MNVTTRLVGLVDRWQRSHPVAGVTWAVMKKSGDDRANLLVVALGWYGFMAIYPMLLVVVTVFGYIGKESLGSSLVNTLHQFPVIGTDLNPGTGTSNLHGSAFGLVVGLVGLIYGAQGVTQVVQQAMAQVWNLPRDRRPGFVARLGRSLAGLLIIGGAFVVNAVAGGYVAKHGQSWPVRIPLVVAMVAMNVVLYWVSFLVLTPSQASVSRRQLLPGALVGAVGFTFLITVGTGLVQHQLRHTTATYGAFASVIGVVTFLLLLAKISLYGAELNPVLAQRLWPRAISAGDPTEADQRAGLDRAESELASSDDADHLPDSPGGDGPAGRDRVPTSEEVPGTVRSPER
jgi:uncharacterized BrkB/YihY/UPF0761 family membrane protein